MKIKFWGTRGSIPAPGKDTIFHGGNTTCLEIDLHNGKRVIIDAGTGIRALCEEFESRTERSFSDYITFCQGADILIHDSHYRPEEISEHRGWGHSDYQSVLELAVKAYVKKLVLFHHAPERKDSDVTDIANLCKALAKERDSNLNIEAAKENSVLVL